MKIHKIGLLVLLLTSLPGCDEAPPAAAVSPSGSASQSPSVAASPATPSASFSETGTRVFRIARIPFKTARAVYDEAETMCSAWAHPFGYDRVEIETARDYTGISRLLSSGAVQAAWLGT